ncbi:MAG: hypothetical protein DRN15_11185 [Thermoprotei archaeon]|nr:MAG: hypothetical protein DRN15_11185 [Thermoprotei archaeon]
MESKAVSEGITKGRLHDRSRAHTVTHGESWSEAYTRTHTKGIFESRGNFSRHAKVSSFTYGQVESISKGLRLTDYDRVTKEYDY